MSVVNFPVADYVMVVYLLEKRHSITCFPSEVYSLTPTGLDQLARYIARQYLDFTDPKYEKKKSAVKRLVDNQDFFSIEKMFDDEFHFRTITCYT